MPMVTPTLNLPQPATSSAASAKPAGLPSMTPPPAASTPALPPAPSTTVTLSPQAMSALAASHPSTASSTSSPSSSSAAAPAPQSDSVYDSLKSGISTAVEDVGDAIAGGAHAVVDGVETVLSDANKVATGILELPFAAVSKAADAVGALIDKF